MRDDEARHFGDALAFGGQPVEALPAPAQEDGDAEFEFELFDARRQAGLRDVAAQSGAAKVLFLSDGDQVFELAKKHGARSNKGG